MKDRIRWEDLPNHVRVVHPEEQRKGRHLSQTCPYAVEATFYKHLDRGLFYQCAASVQESTGVCSSHGLADDPDRQERALMNRVRKMMQGELRRHFWRTWNRIPQERGTVIRWVRSLSDGQILDWRNAGVIAASRVRMIRDTWSDDEVAEFLLLPRDIGRDSAPPEQFWRERHEVLALVGG